MSAKVSFEFQAVGAVSGPANEPDVGDDLEEVAGSLGGSEWRDLVIPSMPSGSLSRLPHLRPDFIRNAPISIQTIATGGPMRDMFP